MEEKVESKLPVSLPLPMDKATLAESASGQPSTLLYPGASITVATFSLLLLDFAVLCAGTSWGVGAGAAKSGVATWRGVRGAAFGARIQKPAEMLAAMVCSSEDCC